MNKIQEIYIYDGNQTLFDSIELNYEIPLYQRSFAWEDKQISELINDIYDFGEDTYYIGSLVVNKSSIAYEVIDGQQRLTALFLILNYLQKELNHKISPTLSFSCRDKSNKTLINIQKILSHDKNFLESIELEETLIKGLDIINEVFTSSDIKIDKSLFIEKLKKVVIFRIEVPDNTDLNRYFEIMNTRGEQLEQHDILKAELMSYIANNETNDDDVFSTIWNAVSDMTGYIQMHFRTDSRKKIFGTSWEELPSADWDYYSFLTEEVENNEGFLLTIDDIIQPTFKVIPDEIEDNDNNRVRFESIIEFPHFLIHCLKAYVRHKNIVSKNKDIVLLNELIDDKKLLVTFQNVINYGFINDEKVNKAQFSKDFILFLLKSRFLFDKFIIKRDFMNNDQDGEWSLQELHKSLEKPYWSMTKFQKSYERGMDENKYNSRCKKILMLQSALRVSYTSPKNMHWITDLLWWLSDEYKIYDLTIFETYTEEIIQKAVYKDFLLDPDYLHKGVHTPHIALNYIDYLLWENNRSQYRNFIFEFRNSVEHWYPQHPEKDAWSDVDRLGNLCLIQRSVNSKFTNYYPDNKKSHFEKMISKGSLKLRDMSDNTVAINNQNASDYWKSTGCLNHEQKIAELLENKFTEEIKNTAIQNILYDELLKNPGFFVRNIEGWDLLSIVNNKRYVYYCSSEGNIQLGYAINNLNNTQAKFLKTVLEKLDVPSEYIIKETVNDGIWIYQIISSNENVSLSDIYEFIYNRMNEMNNILNDMGSIN